MKYLVLLFLIFMTSCTSSIRFSHSAHDYPKDEKVATATTTTDLKNEMLPPGTKFRGMASYYDDKFEGRATASGEIFKQSNLTAAHRELPFGTVVRVTRISNGKSVVVKINDRGPFISGRIIDLSSSAAEAIDLIKAGVDEVEVEIISN